MPFSPEARKAFRLKLQEKGICISCHHNPADWKRVTCGSCRERINAKRDERRRLLGECWDCGAHRSRGSRYCTKHLIVAKQRATKRRAKNATEGRCKCGRLNPDFPMWKTCHSCGDPYKQLLKRIRQGR